MVVDRGKSDLQFKTDCFLKSCRVWVSMLKEECESVRGMKGKTDDDLYWERKGDKRV